MMQLGMQQAVGTEIGTGVPGSQTANRSLRTGVSYSTRPTSPIASPCLPSPAHSAIGGATTRITSKITARSARLRAKRPGPFVALLAGMHVVEFLTQHHRAIEERLKILMKADAAKRAELFKDAADHLMAHVTLEEQRFYPEVRARKTEDILLESLEEHLSLKRVLADLLQLSTSDAHFEPKLHVLKEQVEHHHKEEEEHLFPKVPHLLGDERSKSLGDELERFHDELVKTKPAVRAIDQTDAATPL